MINEKKVSETAAQKLAEEKNIPYFETSAKDATNLDRAFKKLLDNIIDNKNLAQRIQYRGSLDLRRSRKTVSSRERQKCFS